MSSRKDAVGSLLGVLLLIASTLAVGLIKSGSKFARTVTRELPTVTRQADEVVQSGARHVGTGLNDLVSKINWSRLEGESLSGGFFRQVGDFHPWEQPVVRPKLISVVPLDEEGFKRTFNRLPSTSELDGLHGFDLRVAADEGVVRARSEEGLFLEIAANADHSPITILGHSESGGKVLVLPSGDKVHVEDIHAACLQHRRSCVVLTCDSSDLGIQGQITLGDAYSSWDEARSVSEISNQDLAVVDFVSLIRISRRKQVLGRRIGLSALVGGGAGGGAYLVWSQQDGPTDATLEDDSEQ